MILKDSLNITKISLEESLASVDINLKEDNDVSFPVYETYQGIHEVTPHPVNEIILNTQEKLVKSDIKVLKIPYESVSNTYGGKTVTIGGY